MNQWNDPRLLVTLLLISLFAFAYLRNPSDDMMTGAIITAFAAAYGYWLGANKGNDKASDNTGAAFRAIEAAAKAQPPTDEPTEPLP
ncbi:MAG: hypothetical protein J7500_15845 [Sphingomonas sp.]|uniref:hypothetical protein n=1 Tax=Sphingomonas sp. TaxID=28214 RepID=UPI001B11AEBB|nr:hypothetical protein [Sphingomonas sp.]MBO9624181.1 hypothetical protein [Sphingomonas sp.]